VLAAAGTLIMASSAAKSSAAHAQILFRNADMAFFLCFSEKGGG
jgi:hypothetical protein